MKKMTRFIESMRVKQWVKNIFIFAPMIFSLNFFQSDYIVNSVIAFILFSLFTGAIYVLNDCFDKEKDKLHPEKRKRPIASGT
ncbi:MAG: decaprenyl-phosphate phosphoribosyltransferase, partial [Candidatus Aminicenantes bacterium]|nr:decaprenyl-phosphate phosphoribosyltransferase [Candidatus Aminicenantes bacterium]